MYVSTNFPLSLSLEADLFTDGSTGDSTGTACHVLNG